MTFRFAPVTRFPACISAQKLCTCLSASLVDQKKCLFATHSPSQQAAPVGRHGTSAKAFPIDPFEAVFSHCKNTFRTLFASMSLKTCCHDPIFYSSSPIISCSAQCVFPWPTRVYDDPCIRLVPKQETKSCLNTSAVNKLRPQKRYPGRTLWTTLAA